MNDVFSSKFIVTIKTLDASELKAFESWLKSPWCNSNKNLIRLLDRLKKYYPDFNNRKLTKEKLFAQILPHGKFSVRRMNNLLSEGYLAAERFLIFQNLMKDENLQKDLLTKEFQHRHLEDWFFRDAYKEIDRLEEKKIKDWEDHLDLFRLHRRIYHHPEQNPRMQSGRKTIIRMGEELDMLYLLEKAMIINEKVFRNRILKDENHDIETELSKWQQASEGIEHPALNFYKKRFTYKEEDKLMQYLELRQDFVENYQSLNSKEQKVHFQYLLNDTTLFIRAGLLDITDSLLLYKLGIESEIIFHQGILPYNIYTVTVSASNTKSDFDYTNYFIDTYTQKLEQKFQNDALNWAKGHTAYRMNNFEECLDILLSYNFKVLYFLLLSKILTTQVYFDLFLKNDSYESYLFNYFDSFEKWLNREKFRSKFTRQAYLRFVQKCRGLARAYIDVDVDVTKLETFLDNERNIQALSWLKKKKEEIIKLKS